MISVADKVELKASIATIGTDTFTISVTEIFIDNRWEKFTAPKTITVNTTDYDSTVLTVTEKAVGTSLLNRYLSTLTGDDLIAATSLASKLSK